MADTRRGSPGDVTAKLAKEPQRFDFHQAVRLLELQAGRQVGTDAPSMGMRSELRTWIVISEPASRWRLCWPSASSAAPSPEMICAGTSEPTGGMTSRSIEIASSSSSSPAEYGAPEAQPATSAAVARTMESVRRALIAPAPAIRA